MTERIIGNQIRLIPYYRNDAVSLPWYQAVSYTHLTLPTNREV